jgi:hypothetical protein
MKQGGERTSGSRKEAGSAAGYEERRLHDSLPCHIACWGPRLIEEPGCEESRSWPHALFGFWTKSVTQRAPDKLRIVLPGRLGLVPASCMRVCRHVCTQARGYACESLA